LDTIAGMSELILVLVRDLMFASKITATAQSMQVPVKLIREPEKLASEPGERLIVDLNQPGAMEAASSWKSDAARSVIGFVSHVDRETIDRARSLGIDQILPRSQFVARLTELLK
jgi:hypothetical protein